MRSLAQRSAGAAKEIKALINDSVDKVAAGSRLVNEAGSTMQEIVSSIQRVTDIISEITAASEEQTSGIEQVNQAITQMDNTTQQNSALVEEAAAATQSMREQAERLADVVAVFKLDADHSAALRSSTAGSTGSSSSMAASNRRSSLTPLGAPPASSRHNKRGADVRHKANVLSIKSAPKKASGDDWEEF